jgi:hypothetical protein
MTAIGMMKNYNKHVGLLQTGWLITADKGMLADNEHSGRRWACWQMLDMLALIGILTYYCRVDKCIIMLNDTC